MSARARRLAKYLDEVLGWTVYDDVKTCKCGNKEYGREKKFCSKCSAKLPAPSPQEDTIEQLERALKFALKRAYIE